MMDQHRGATPIEKDAPGTVALSSPSQLRAQFVEQYLVRRRRIRVMTVVTSLAIFGAYVLHALANVVP